VSTADIGVFGGSGFYSFLDDVTEETIDTPYGEPTAAVRIGTIGDRRVAFLPRHGASHEFPPHKVNYRANLWAMHELGVSRVLGPCASGSLQAHIAPGDFVVCDQLVDRTSGRVHTFFDGPEAYHAGFADPYCPELRTAAVEAGRAEGITTHDGGTVVVVEGPRFSTRAESQWYGRQGWEVINMTQHPEAVLARELGLCYCTIALVTDYDVGVDGENHEPVTQEQVFAFFEANVDKIRGLLFRAIEAIPTDKACDCKGDSPLAR
jgi:5'-methylthioadenosine phosphorylase